jgi:hypothetical protein
MNQNIIDAIQNKKTLKFTYNNFPRIMEPHIYGCSKKGEELLLCYQIKGVHTSDKIHDWCFIKISEITSSIDFGDKFHGARQNYNREEKRIPTIYAQL